MRRNWMPLYVPDFLADTGRLSTAETGAYLCLIMDYWMHDGLPDDDHKLAAITRQSVKSWRAMRPTIQAFFRDGWRHKRIDAELTKMVGTSIRRSEAASKAGTVSAMKRANGTYTPRARHVDAAYTPRAPSVHHTTQERKITTTTSEAAREVSPVENPENPQKPPPEPAETPIGSPAKGVNLAASPELLATLARKYR